MRRAVQRTVSLAIIIGMLGSSGCTSIRKMGASDIPESGTAQSSENITQEYNQKLGEITDEQSAQAAVDYFAGYVAGKLEPKDPKVNVAAFKTQNLTNLKKVFSQGGLATQELRARQNSEKSGAIGAQSASESGSTSLYTIDTVVKELNSRAGASGSTSLQFSRKEVAGALAQLRKTIPNVALSEDSEILSPLEANTLMWTLLTGDDGASPNDPIKVDKGISAPSTSQAIKPQFWGIIWWVAFWIEVGDLIRTTIDRKTIWGEPLVGSETSFLGIKCGNPEYSTKRVEYYTGEDLERMLSRIGDYTEFDNSNPPRSDIAFLPSRPSQYGVADNIYAIASRRGDNFRTAGWGTGTGTGAITFEFDKVNSRVRKGDLVFSRGTGRVATSTSKISSWTHVGVIHSTDGGVWKSFESFLDRGVDYYYPATEWGPSVSWSVRRVGTLSAGSVATAVDNSVKLWAKSEGKSMPYFPHGLGKMTTPENTLFKQWCYKRDPRSMYCSKLVWNIGMQAGLNLDSNRTRFRLASLAVVPDDIMETAKDDNGTEVRRAWIGVSPDDIYYSKQMGEEIYTHGISQLTRPLVIQ